MVVRRPYDPKKAVHRADYWAQCLRGQVAKAHGLETFPVWHGRRIKSPKSVVARGIGPQKLSHKNLTKELLSAIDFAGKSYLLENKNKVFCDTYRHRRHSRDWFDCDFINMAAHELGNPRKEWRRSIFVSARKDNPEMACSWAWRNPEIIFLLLTSLMLERDKPRILDYMTKKYGEPYAIRLNCDFDEERANYSTYRPWIAPEEIKEVVSCIKRRPKYL